MHSPFFVGRRGFIILSLLTILVLPANSNAQIISLKTVPLATGDQFLIFPSRNLGLGGVSIAMDDPLLDPFVNPAKGARIAGTHLFTSTSFYSISEDNGSGRTLPLGLLYGSDRMFGGGSLAIQQLLPDARDPDFSPSLLSEKSANNIYAFGMIGKKLPGADISLAGSLSWASLNALDGVKFLYAGSSDIEQSGNMLDCRIGLLGELSGERSYELLLLHNRLDMTHDVSYSDWGWSPWPRTRVERNLDRTNTTGLHLGYVQPFGEEGWRAGGILTCNMKSHPKIPEYELENSPPIPRDPGNSWAWNMGMGISGSQDDAIFGMDLIYEPVRSHTWAEAESYIEGFRGRMIPPGGKTVENHFRFSNLIFRIGMGRESGSQGLQLGLQVKAVNYDLVQYNNLDGTRREQQESWMEWTPTWGLSMKFSEFHIRYTGRLTTGTGMPGVAWLDSRNPMNEEGELVIDPSSGVDFMVAPGGDLTLRDALVMSHQISISIPIKY